MTWTHRRKLLVVRQSATGSVCELVNSRVDNAACRSCGSCSGLLSNPDKTTPIELPFDLAVDQVMDPAVDQAMDSTVEPATDSPISLFHQYGLHSLKTGQSFELEVPAGMLLALSSVVYVLPVVLMLFFMLCCDLFFGASEAQIALSAFVGFGAGLSAIVFLAPALRLHIAKYLTVRSS